MLYTSRYTERQSNAISDGYKFQPNILIPVFFNGLTEIFQKNISVNEKNTTQVSIAKCVIVNKKNLLCYCCLLNSYEEKNAGKASELFRNSKKGF